MTKWKSGIIPTPFAGQEIKETREPKEMLGKYLMKPLVHRWTEDFIDSSTGEIVSVERHQEVFSRKDRLTKDDIAAIQGVFLMYDIKGGAFVSDQRRPAKYKICKSMVPMVVTFQTEQMKKKALLYASGIESCLEIFKDYMAQYLCNSFGIIKVEHIGFGVVIDDFELPEQADMVENDGQDSEDKDLFYVANLVTTDLEDRPIKNEFFVKAPDALTAHGFIDAWIARDKAQYKAKNPNMDYIYDDNRVDSIKQYAVDLIVEKSFSEAHLEKQRNDGWFKDEDY